MFPFVERSANFPEAQISSISYEELNNQYTDYERSINQEILIKHPIIRLGDAKKSHPGQWILYLTHKLDGNSGHEDDWQVRVFGYANSKNEAQFQINKLRELYNEPNLSIQQSLIS